MAKKVRIGDIVQILHAKGVSYAQVTHTHPKYKFVLRVFPGIYLKRPGNFVEVVSREPQFTTFFLVQHAVSEGLLSVVANVPVHEDNQIFPTFRWASRGKEGERGAWWLIDDVGERRLDRPLTDEEKNYPATGLISAPLLIERIEENYRSSNDV